jgi:hypothetical protein
MPQANISQLSEKNRKAYLDLIDTFWEFDDESRAFIEERISPTWEFPPEIKDIISKGEYDGDQRVIWSLANEESASADDKGYCLFRKFFSNALDRLNREGINIGYAEYQDNKVRYKNNLTKIKKVLEIFYASNHDYKVADLGNISDESIEETIIKKYERIGTFKKPKNELEMVLSFNPIDWMLCSTSSPISSCLNLENGGGGYKFFGGLPFLCGDPNRGMIYFSKGETKEYRGMKVDQPITRSWCILTKNNYMEIVKWYANEIYSISQIRSFVKDVEFRRLGEIDRGLYNIKPLHLKNGLIFTIFNDIGKYIKRENDKGIESFVFDGTYGKGGFQLFHKTGFELTGGEIFSYERPYPLKDRANFRIDDFERVGLTFNNIPHKVNCPHCHQEKIFLLVNNEESCRGAGTICFDCAKEKSFCCEKCGNISFVESYEAEFVEDRGAKIVKKRICKRCFASSSKCTCCGRFLTNNSYVNDEKRNQVCKFCINDTSKNYHVCSTCGNYGINYKMAFNHDKGVFEWYCKEHLPTMNEEKFSNKYAHYTGGIYLQCNTCKNITLDKFTGHCIFCDSKIKGKQFTL